MVRRCAKQRAYLYHDGKPAGVLTATRDAAPKPCFDLLPPALKGGGCAAPAGRLDKDTTGLLILTDDGDYAHCMLAPKSHVMKRYEAVLDLPAEAAAWRPALPRASGAGGLLLRRRFSRFRRRAAHGLGRDPRGKIPPGQADVPRLRKDRLSRRSDGFPSAPCVLTPRWAPERRAFCRKKRLCLSSKRN